MSLRIYTPADAAEAMQTTRQRIDAACESGAIVAVDDQLDPSKPKRRRWRILEDDLIDWHRRGRPLTP